MIEDTPDLPLIGYSLEKITHEIVINVNGLIVAIHDLQENGKPAHIIVPAHKGRTAEVNPYLLCDTSKYIFGCVIDKNGEKKQFPEHLKAMIKLHKDWLIKCQDKGLSAFVEFLTLNRQEKQSNIFEDLLNGTNLVFRLEGEPQYIHQSNNIRNNLSLDVSDVKEVCLLTGKVSDIARIHQGIKGVKNTASKGASLVGVNIKCAESDNRKQAYNSPIATDVMNKYTNMLNYLISSHKHKMYCGDDTYVFWTKSEIGQEFILHQLMGAVVDDLETTNDNIRQLFEGLSDGLPTDLKTDHVYLLTLAGVKGRISVKGWYEGCLSDIIRNAKQHQDDLSIIGLNRLLTPYDLLRVSTRDGKVDKIPGAVNLGLRQAILNANQQYPRKLYVDILDRLRKDPGANSTTNTIRYAIIKAYLQRLDNRRSDRYMLDMSNTNTGYNLGRLFAIYEKIQYMANKKITINDRFFSGASTTPLAVYPYLRRLSSKHINTLKNRGLYTGEDVLAEVIYKINEIPVKLNLHDQGEFMLGYDHQKQHDKSQALATVAKKNKNMEEEEHELK